MDEQKEDDEIFELEGITFVAEQRLATMNDMFHVDYINNWIRKGFVVSAQGSSNC